MSSGIQDRQTVHEAGTNGSRIDEMIITKITVVTIDKITVMITDAIATGMIANGMIVPLETTAAGGLNTNEHSMIENAAGGEQTFNLIEDDGHRHHQEAPEFRGNAHPIEPRRYLGTAHAVTHQSE